MRYTFPMQKSHIVRNILIGVVVYSAFAFAHADDTLTSSACDSLFGLAAGTISTAASQKYLNPATCAAYQDLITRYHPGPDSSIGLSNAKVQGITSLNSTFALNLDSMLKAADAAGFRITINSAYRSSASEAKANPTAYSRGFVSMHTKGLAADLQYPNDGAVTTECDGLGSNLSAAYKWVAANAAAYHMGLYDQLHSHVPGECNHVEASSGSTSGELGPGVPDGTGNIAGSGSTVPYSITPGLGGPSQTPQPGQYMTQDSSCVVSQNPYIVVRVPAGTEYPSGCLGTGTQQSGMLQQPYCSGSTVMYNNGSTMMPGQYCQYGCQNGMCMQAQQQQQTASQQSSATSPTTGTTQTSTNNTPTTPTTNATTPAVTTSTLTTPNLVSNIGNSATGIVNLLSNPASTTSTPIFLNPALSNVTQLQANGQPGVTQANPTSIYFASSSKGGAQQSGGSPAGGSPAQGDASGSSGFTTTGGSGYDMTGATDSNGQPVSTTTALAGTQQNPNGTNTFGPTPTNNSLSSFQSQGSVTTVPSQILDTLKSAVLFALNFLTSYLHPASVSN